MNNVRQFSEKIIAQKMKEKNIVSGQKTADWFTKEGNKPILRYWGGIKFK